MEEREEREQTTPLGNPLNLPCEPFALPSMVTATANDKDPDTFGDGIIRPPGNKLYRAQLPSEYRSPVLQDDPLSTHDWMFKNHGKSLKKQRTELLPRSDTIKFDVGKDKDELLRNLQLSGCPDALHETVHKLVTEDWDVFAESGLRNSIRGFSFQVDTGDAKPIDCGAPRYGPNESPIIVKLVDTLENNGLVEDNTGPWGALIVLAAKPHQGLKRWEEFQWRLCVSYRKLNQVTKPFRYPIPRCDDAVEDIDALARWFISVDMDSGYWQIPADPETREKLAFYTPNGKKHWTVMPMGALNSAPVFVAMMETLKQEWNKLAAEAEVQHCGTKVIIDDVLVYGREFDELVKYFKIVLSVLMSVHGGDPASA